MEFSRQENWSGLPFPSSGDLPDPGIEPGSPALQADSLPSEPLGSFLKTGDGSSVNSASCSRADDWKSFCPGGGGCCPHDRGSGGGSWCLLTPPSVPGAALNAAFTNWLDAARSVLCSCCCCFPVRRLTAQRGQVFLRSTGQWLVSWHSDPVISPIGTSPQPSWTITLPCLTVDEAARWREKQVWVSGGTVESHLELREQVGVPEPACLWTWARARGFARLTVCERLSPSLFTPHPQQKTCPHSPLSFVPLSLSCFPGVSRARFPGLTRAWA